MKLYKPLGEGRREIRVVTLVSDVLRPERGLRCKFRIFQLCDQLTALRYTALSYVWGSEGATEEIVVNDIPIRIRRNLYQALCRIWTHEPGIAVWADAICINQKNLLEKADQVQLMNLIYQDADYVSVWLGEEEYGTRQAWNVIYTSPTLVRDRGEEATGTPQPWDVGSKFPTFRRDEDVTMQDRQLILALNDLGTRPWYSRCWTFQEIVLAKTANVLCGELIMPWNRFEDNLLRLAVSLSRKWKSLLSSSINNLKLLQKARRLKREDPGLFLDMLITNRLREASNPRDKIYSLLGLPQVHKLVSISISYTCSIAVVYTKATRCCIELTQNLRALRGAGLRFSLSTQKTSSIDEENSMMSSGDELKYTGEQAGLTEREWPSWVPNWSDSGIIALLDEKGDSCELQKQIETQIQPKVVLGSPSDGTAIEIGGIALGYVTQPAEMKDGLSVASFPICLGTRVKHSNDEDDLAPIDLYLRACLELREGTESQIDALCPRRNYSLKLKEVAIQKAMDKMKLHDTKQCSCFRGSRKVRMAKLRTDSVPIKVLARYSDSWGIRPDDLICLFHGSYDFFILRAVDHQKRTGKDVNDTKSISHFSLITSLINNNEVAHSFVVNTTRFAASFILV